MANTDALQSIDLSSFGESKQGKVRDMCVVGNRRVLVTTDRVSAFDRFGHHSLQRTGAESIERLVVEQLSDVVDNHVVELPDPNVMITHEAKPLPVEVIVRGYITGSTSTSLWTLYKNGVERPYGLRCLKVWSRISVCPSRSSRQRQGRSG